MSTQFSDTELASISIHDTHDHTLSSSGEIEQRSLPPPDTGKAAWLVLAGCSLVQIPVWGFPISFGVFQEYYTRHPSQLRGSVESYAVIGTTFNGILYLSSPLTFTILSRFPRLRPYFGPLGLLLATMGFLASAFTTTVQYLIVTQGVVCALGCGLLFTPSTVYLDEWFVKRKGLALGVMWAGKSVAGVALPFLMEVSLRKYGPRTTLLAWTTATILLTIPLLRFLRPRIPLSPTHTIRPISLSFLRLPSFWTLQIGNILQSLGYFLPYTYLSTYAVQQAHLSSGLATLLLALINAMSVPGGIVFGGLGDKFSVRNVTLISALGSAVAVFGFWGFCPTPTLTLASASASGSGSGSGSGSVAEMAGHRNAGSIALLALFSLTYGFFAGGFSSTWSGIQTSLKSQDPNLDTAFVFGLLAGGRGIGNVGGGFVGVKLLGADGWRGRGKNWGYGTEYGPVIVFTGISAVLGGWDWLGSWCL